MDLSPFAAASFNPKDYANAIVASQSKHHDASAIPALTTALERVQSQIKSLVAAQHDQLLLQPSAVAELHAPLADVRSHLNELDNSLQKLQTKISLPHQSLQELADRLDSLSRASDLLRRVSRFVVLAKRLRSQMAEIDAVPAPQQSGDDEKERAIAKAALTIAQLGSLLGDADKVSIRSVHLVAGQIPFIEDSRATITADMQEMILSGLTSLDQSLLASSLQTAYNLGVLPDLVQSLVRDLSEAVDDRIRNAFDLSSISRDASAREAPSAAASSSTLYKSRIRTEPTNLTAPQWTAALWTRLQSMIEEMAGCCIKVYTLETVLRLKKDTFSHAVFLDEAMRVLESRPTTIFWTSLGTSLEKYSRDSMRNSQFLQQTLTSGYPKILRLFHEFFAKIAVHTDVIYTQTHQSPETVLVLRALNPFEALYLNRSSTRLNESVAQMLSRGTRAPPTPGEVANFTRSITNELDSARFDPLLLRSVAKGVIASLETLVARVESHVPHDRPSIASASQFAYTGPLSTCLYRCHSELLQLKDSHASIFPVIEPAIQSIERKFEEITKPMLLAIQKELEAIVNRIHRLDLAKPVDRTVGLSGGSIYMKDLVERLGFIKSEILGQFHGGDEFTKKWLLMISKNVARSFVLHASIASPLGESGKLQLTSDMTELEFALSAFVSDGAKSKRGSMLEAVGTEYRALRSMKQLLFLENTHLSSPQYTPDLTPLVVLHHILVRSPIPLPHRLHNWQEAEYVRWIEEHSDEEAWTLLDSSLSHWEAAEGGVREESEEYVKIAKAVLGHARKTGNSAGH